MAVTVTHATVTAVPDDPAYDIGSDEWNAAHTVTNALDKTGDTMTGTLTSTIGTITADQQSWTGTATWNNAAVKFTGIKYNVTDTSSNSSSLLMDLQVGGVTMAGVYKSGIVYSIFRFTAPQFFTNGGDVYVADGGVIAMASFGIVRWSDSTSAVGGSIDLAFTRNAAGVVEVNNGTAGTYRDLLARNVVTSPTTVAGLAGAQKGARAFVTDATATTFASIVAGGGANNVPVYYDGTNWRIG